MKSKKGLRAGKDCMMEEVKLNNDMAETSPQEAGFFYRRIVGTLFKVRVYTGLGYADTPDKKISRLILPICIYSNSQNGGIIVTISRHDISRKGHTR